jgi:peroxiredoxin
MEVYKRVVGDLLSHYLEGRVAEKPKRAFSLFLVVLIFVSLHFLILWKQANAESHLWDNIGVIRIDERVKAPSFTLKDLNGKEVNLEDYRGKIVFINFWATWCLPCREEMPSMEKLYSKFKDSGFTMLAVNIREGTKKVRAFKERFGLNFPILLDSDGRVGSKYGVISIPTTYLIDREGYVIGGALGTRDWASKEAFALIDQLLRTKPHS